MSYAALIPDNPNLPEVVRAGQVARWLGVTPATLYAWSRAGKLPAVLTLGPRTHVYRVADLRAALEQLDRQMAGAAKGE